MLRVMPALSRSASRWAFQVSTSLGATLVAALIVQMVQRPVAERPASPPELTTGGKFAARVASPEAFDGLDRMPLPHVDAAPARPAAFLAVPPSAPDALAALDAAIREPAATPPLRDRTRHTAKPPLRAESRRPAPPPVLVLAAAPAAVGPTAEASDDGAFHKVAATTLRAWSATASTTRQAWNLTAAAGSSLLSHLMP